MRALASQLDDVSCTSSLLLSLNADIARDAFKGGDMASCDFVWLSYVLVEGLGVRR